MSTVFARAQCALIPASGLLRLAVLRGARGIRVFVEGDRAWVRWEAGEESIIRKLLPVPGVEFFEQRDGAWYRPGRRFPCQSPPLASITDPLAKAIVPEAIPVEESVALEGSPCRLGLVMDDRVRSTSAMECSADALAAWADGAATAQLSRLRAACRGGRVFVLGRPLPLIEDSERFWGTRLLRPLGYRTDPDLFEDALITAIGGAPEELLVLRPDRIEAIPLEAFRPATRAGARLAARKDPA